ncbi:phBC6A51 family helix-turn-helix protein [Paenibacillus sp. BT-177]|uniref:phBC6A51 family helix-turn-helix protein n=1 Tax=Paenibacillus sp. BT-177 TaxID=2986930 RepID=UPI0021F7351C|nr:phBC6A51 family helix-turn-helix protein [Paenibacillus sp. BT-177]
MTNKKRKRRARPPLDERHRLAIEMLARKGIHDTMDEIASLCGVDRRTLYRWRQREDFNKEYEKVHRGFISAIRRRHKSTVDWLALSSDELTERCRMLGLI